MYSITLFQANIRNGQNLIDNINDAKLNIFNCELADTICGDCLQNYLLDLNCRWCLTKTA